MPETDLTRRNVLIVDDDADNLGVVVEYLSFVGLNVRSATDGQTGMKALESFTPQLILLDLSMPNMDGWQMLKELRGNPKLASIPVIALTAHAMTHDLEQIMEAGFNGYVTKPFILSSFHEYLKRWLEQPAPTQNGHPKPPTE
jgi:CheY-like chemotaxis protein